MTRARVARVLNYQKSLEIEAREPKSGSGSQVQDVASECLAGSRTGLADLQLAQADLGFIFPFWQNLYFLRIKYDTVRLNYIGEMNTSVN